MITTLKSIVLAFIVNQFPTANILVVAPSTNLVNNLAKTIKSVSEIEVGKIGGGKSKIDRVTVSTGQSLMRNAKGKYQKFLKDIDVIIFDECHSYGNNTGETISAACPKAHYRIGLSATVARQDGSDLVLKGVIGPWVKTVPDTLMVDLGVIHHPNVYFLPVKDPKVKYTTIFGNSRADRVEVYKKALVKNETRNNLIVDVVEAYKNSREIGGSTLILVEQLEHGEILTRLLKDKGIEAPFIYGKTPKQKKEQAVKDFKSGKLTTLVASRILNEGEDVPILELVINAAGGSGARGIIQKTGRALRKDDTKVKTQAIIVDFLDQERQYLNYNAQRRIANLEKRHPNCVTNITFDELLKIFND